MLRIGPCLRRVRQLHRSGCDVHDVEFLRQRVDDDAHLVQASGEDRFPDRRARHVQPPRAQFGDGRHRSHVDLLFREAFNAAQQPVLARFGEGDGGSGTARAAGSADAMHVGFRGRRHVVVHHVREVLDVEPARRHVGRHEQVGLAAAKQLHHAIALALFHPAVERLRAAPVRVQRFDDRLHLEPRPAEHYRRRRVLHVSSRTRSA